LEKVIVTVFCFVFLAAGIGDEESEEDQHEPRGGERDD
jgi:hypothetical protein